MKKVNIFKLEKALAGFSFVFCLIAANSKCMFIFHDPKKPESLSKFRKW